jgi:murein DD-endopeptidase MepM/ murein hydrolase activator NlpD
MAGVDGSRSPLDRIRETGRRKLTLMIVPHTERRVLSLQLSFFALWGVLLAVGLGVLAFLFAAARFSDTANKLQTQSSDLASTQESLAAIREQSARLAVSTRRFERSLSAAVGGKPPSPAADPADSGASAGAAGEAAGEIGRAADYIASSVEPLQRLGSRLQRESDILTEVPNIWPVLGSGRIASYFGRGVDEFTGKPRINRGVEIAAFRPGDTVLSTADGAVAEVGYDPVFGNYVLVQHGHGFSTKYGHLMAARVVPGQKVRQGQAIGLLGNTGRVAGPRLLYEVHVGTGTVDPLEFLNVRPALAAAN